MMMWLAMVQIISAQTKAHYQYAHNHENSFALHEFLPDDITGTKLYEPGENQREKGLREFLKKLWNGKYDY